MRPLGTRMNNAVGLWRNGNFQQELCWSWLLCWKNMPPLGTRKNSAIGLWLHCKSWGFLTNKDGLHHRSPGHRDAKDRKSTRLNSSHTVISYAVFCLKKKKKKE